MGARHADHVELAAFDGVPRRRHVLDARRVERRHARRGADFAGEIEVRRGSRAHAGNDVRERLVRVDMAADHVDEVDEARGGEALCDRYAFLAREAAVPVLVAHHPDADEEIVSHVLADRAQDVEAEAHAVLERPAVGIVALVGGGRPELVDQVAVAFEGAITGSQSALLQLVRRPRCVTWTITAAPCACTSSASSFSQRTASSL